METSIVARNIAILKEVLSGNDYATCAKKYNISVASVGSSIRHLLQLLKDHTDIDIMVSSSYVYLLEKKNLISKYLVEPFPKVSLTPAALAYLQKTFGKYYAREPETVAAAWADIYQAFHPFRDQRDLLSIQKWLATENYLVGKILTDEMLDFAWESIQGCLSSLTAENAKHTFTVKKVVRTGWKTKLILEADIHQGTHHVRRRFSIDLLPS